MRGKDEVVEHERERERTRPTRKRVRGREREREIGGGRRGGGENFPVIVKV